MTMIRTHRNNLITTVLRMSFFLFFYDIDHYIIHVYISSQMAGFMKTIVAVALSTSKVKKVDSRSQSLHNTGEIIVGAYSKRTCTNTQSVVNGICYICDKLQVRFGANHSWKAKE